MLTKRLAEDLTSYLHDRGLRVRYLHSEIDTHERIKNLRELREGAYDVLVGVNLLREGLDLPEVSLVCIVDADKAGFLRSETSLIQTMGRAARNVNALVIMYADRVTEQMQAAIDETGRRRAKQVAFNKAHGITARTIQKAIRRGIEKELQGRKTARAAVGLAQDHEEHDRDELVRLLSQEMVEAADRLEFEKAAELRDRIAKLKELPDFGTSVPAGDPHKAGAARSRSGITGRRGRRASY